jgi:hypothetical protein
MVKPAIISTEKTRGDMMKKESLRGIRTMREVRTSLSALRPGREITTNSLRKENIEDDADSPPDARLKQILANEKARAAAFEASVAKSQQNMLKLRDKLAATIKRNEELTRLRKEIQQARWENKPASPAVEHTPKEDYDTTKLKY